MATSFEQLKREAVQLERQLEDKVSRYQQVGFRSRIVGNLLILLSKDSDHFVVASVLVCCWW